LRKFAVALLVVFVATLFAAGTALAYVRHEPDFGRTTTLTADGAANGADGAVVWVLSKDVRNFGGGPNTICDQRLIHYGLNPSVDITSNDYRFLQLVSDDLFYYNDVPDSVVACLYGGNGDGTRVPQDAAGYTVGQNHAYNIVDMLGVNPVLNDRATSAVVCVYLLSMDVTAATNNSVSVPVALNVTNEWMSVPGASDDTRILGNAKNVVNDEYWNRRFAGLRPRDIRLVKMSIGDGPNEQIEYERVHSAGALRQQRFVVSRYNEVTKEDAVLGLDAVLNGKATLDRLVYRDRDGIAGIDFTTKAPDPTSVGRMIGSPAVIFAENPIITTADVSGVPVTTEPVYGFAPETRDGLGLDFEYQAIIAPMDATQKALANNLYPDYTRRIMGGLDGTMALGADTYLWPTQAAIEQYGFVYANAIRFPATMATPAVGNSALVAWTLRPGAGFGGSAGLDMLVANANTVGDLRLINATGGNFPGQEADAPLEYEQVFSAAALADGTFAVVNGANAVLPADHVFQAGGVYKIVAVARDGGDFDVDQGTQGNNVGKNNRCVHYFTFATVGAAPEPSVVPEPSVEPEPSEEPTPTPSGSSGGGCSVGFAPAAVLLLAPLFVLLKK